MILSQKAQKIYSGINDRTKLGDLRNIAKEIKKDHVLAMELWSTGKLLPRLLSILIMDSKELNSDLVQTIIDDIESHAMDERTQLADWLMANQLVKSKNTLAMINSWLNSSSAIQRRIYWYHQARLRWVGQTPPDNTAELLSIIEQRLADEDPEVQWAMNFTAGWIGIFEQRYRSRCMTIGENFGLYKDDVVSKGCTPNYLPKFIEIETKKRNLV